VRASFPGHKKARHTDKVPEVLVLHVRFLRKNLSAQNWRHQAEGLQGLPIVPQTSQGK
jgi:hypothetical protein